VLAIYPRLSAFWTPRRLNNGRVWQVLLHATQDVVVYSDDGGRSWTMSETPLPGCGEAQLAELSHTSHHAQRKQHAIIFNGTTSVT
jgi:hypothetical protein